MLEHENCSFISPRKLRTQQCFQQLRYPAGLDGILSVVHGAIKILSTHVQSIVSVLIRRAVRVQEPRLQLTLYLAELLRRTLQRISVLPLRGSGNR